MIVVDTNILAYLYLPTDQTSLAEQLLIQEPDWCAPRLWRSEFRNVLALYLRKNLVSLSQVVSIQAEAESLLAGNEFEVPSRSILELVHSSDCSAYDCEFVALAKQLDIQLVTADKKVLKGHPQYAFSLTEILKPSAY